MNTRPPSSSRSKSKRAGRERAVLVAGCTLLLGACAATKPDTKNEPVPVYGPPVSLAINGFNYTDLPIDHFSVAGAGGGNIFVSSPTSGGGSTSCCLTWRPSTPLPKPIKVEWMRNLDGKRRWCEKTVQLTGPVPDKPTALGVHFMPGGDIQVEITRGYPKLKLQLQNFDDGRRHESGNVIHDEQTARCRDGR
jgi:hypothetical protein